MLIGHAQHAYVLSMCGRTEEALAAARRAHELDPLSASVRFEPFVLWNARRFGDALAGWEALERLMPGLFFVTMWRAIALVALERHSEALALLRQHADAYTDNWSRLTTAALLAACGDIAGARSRLAKLHEQERTEYMWPIGFAMAYGFLGKTDRAFQYLERAYEDRAGWITLLPTGSFVDPLRGDARLDALIRKIGAPVEPTSYRPPVRRLAKPSVAVLPLTNMSASADDEYFADGMTEDIIAQLSKVASLKVISRTSVMRYKKTDKNVGEVAKELGASHVVEGSVRRAGQRLRIVTQLIEAATDAHLWAETFDRDQADVFAIQTEVATRVATGLRQRLSAVEERLVSKRPTADLEAYNLYLLGRRHYNLALGDDLQASRARDYYDRAIAQDPTFARAYAAKAELEMWRSTGYFGVRPQEGSAKAVALAERALSLDPEIGEAHIVLAWHDSWIRYDFTSADARCRRAVELNPSHAFARIMYAMNLASMGRLDEAIESGRQAVELDPWTVFIRGNAIMLYGFARRHEEFETELRLAEASGALGPASVIFRAQDAIPRGAAAEVLPGIRALALQAPMIVNRLLHAWCAAAAGEAREARNILAELHALEPQQYIWATGLALTYAYLGERDRAFELLERAYEDRAGWMSLVNCCPAFDVFRGDPRFETIVKRVGASPA